MKLSRKARKYLIILSILLSPVLVILLVYLVHWNEPAGYTALRQEVITNDNPSMTSSKNAPATTGPGNQHVQWKNLGYVLTMLNRFPKLTGHCQNILSEGLSIEEAINQKKLLAGRKAYIVQSPLEEEKIKEIHRSCDYLEELFQQYQGKPTEGLFQELIAQDMQSTDPIKLAILRAAMNDQKELATSMLDQYIQMVSLPQREKAPYILHELFPVQFLWWCFELGLLDELDLDGLKAKLIRQYKAINDPDRPIADYTARNRAVFEQCEQYCQQIQSGDYQVRDTSTNLFLKDNLGGLPYSLWSGFLKPIRIQRAKNLAVAMSTDDTEKYFIAMQRLDQVTKGIYVFHYGVINATDYGIYPEEILGKYPWLRSKKDNTIRDRIYLVMAFLTMIEQNNIEGSYPRGPINVKELTEFMKGYFDARVIYPDEFKVHQEIKVKDSTDYKEETLDLSNTPVFVCAWDKRYFQYGESKYSTLDLLFPIPVTIGGIVDQLNKDRVFTTNYKWAAPSWEYAEPVLREILVDQRPEEPE